MSSTASFPDSLLELKQQYLKDVQSGKGGEWTVVMGNEAGDLDSMASSIALAWFLNKSNTHSPAIALNQTERADLVLRPENTYALSLSSLSDSHLLCINDISQSTSSSEPQPFPSHRFALVDHNRLLSRFSSPSPSSSSSSSSSSTSSPATVVAIIDHHDDEGLHKDTASPRIITVPTGSCTSLVANHISSNLQSPDDIPSELASLLLCGILIDTAGLKPGGKAEKADREAAEYLFPRSTLFLSEHNTSGFSSEKGKSMEELTSTLMKRKMDVSHLSVYDLLRRDYKQYEWSYTPTTSTSSASPTTLHVGLSTVPANLKQWVSPPTSSSQFWNDTLNFMSSRSPPPGLSILGILTTYRSKKNKHKRRIMLILRPSALSTGTPDKGFSEQEVEELEKKLYSGLKGSEELKLDRKKGLEEKFHALKGQDAAKDEVRFRIWMQGDANKTRKAVAPLMRRIIEGEEK